MMAVCEECNALLDIVQCKYCGREFCRDCFGEHYEECSYQESWYKIDPDDMPNQDVCGPTAYALFVLGVVVCLAVCWAGV